MLSFIWQWTLQDTCMTTSFVYFSWMLTVNHLLWLLNYRRNRISFVSLDLCVSLIRWVLVVWSWRSVGYTDFNPPGPLISVIHTASSFHPFTSSHTDFSSFPRTFPPCSAEAVHAECSFYPFIVFRALHSFSLTLHFPWPSPFFIRLKINTLKNKQLWKEYTSCICSMLGRLMHSCCMTTEIALVSLHHPRPYVTHSHMHTGPLVIATATPSLSLNPTWD